MHSALHQIRVEDAVIIWKLVLLSVARIGVVQQ